MILGFPWLTTFNPEINWAEGQIKGPKIQLKTTALVAKEHEATAISTRRAILENVKTIRIQKVTIAQQMAEKYHDEAKVNTESTIPEEYKRHAKVFSEQEATQFPPSREWDHKITLKPDAPETINAKMYTLPKPGREAIQNWVDNMLKKGFIQISDSPYGHATFTVPKKDGTFRIVQDYRPVNKYTVKDTTPLPSIQEAIEGLGDKVLFSKYDIREGYNNIQIVPKDRWKAAFKTPMGLYEPNVMLFRLQGTPGTFSRMIAVDVGPMYKEFPQNRFKHYMDDCLVATADGELALHKEMNHRLLGIFEEHSYFLKPAKCIFEQQEVDFLGVRLGHGQITIDPSKLLGLKNGQEP
jgi:hypothetical protein